MEKSYSRLSCGSGGGSFVQLLSGAKSTCEVDGCDKEVKCKALCQPHYFAARYKPKPRAKKEQIECRSCSGFFTPRSPSAEQKYCSRDCASAVRRVPNPTCKNCGVEYRAKTASRNTYCSRACTFSAKHKAQKEDYLPSSAVYFRTCEVCAKPWTARNALSRVCGVACSRKANAEVAKMNAEQAHRKAARTTRCMHCDCKFSPLYGSSHAKACTPCVESVARANRSARRDARKAKYKLNKLDPFKVFDRDGWKCQDCGVSTPRAKRGSYADDAPELDHIRPLSKGGAHSYENTQCLCRRCNAIKSDTWVPETESI